MLNHSAYHTKKQYNFVIFESLRCRTLMTRLFKTVFWQSFDSCFKTHFSVGGVGVTLSFHNFEIRQAKSRRFSSAASAFLCGFSIILFMFRRCFQNNFDIISVYDDFFNEAIYKFPANK